MSETSRSVDVASWGAEGGTWALLVHGGAGEVSSARIAAHVEGCRSAAQAGAAVLRAGGCALDAVERAVVVLEDDPHFNAGTGACLNVDGHIELDAALMEGSRLRGGGVCALPPFPHPIAIARAVLDDGVHVLYAGPGAERFALERGFARSTDEAMTTAWAREQWAVAQSPEGHARSLSPSSQSPGTVGAVARDARGTVASATSTGGRAHKRAGRVGDSPILGAGTYADDDAGACSATGIGEAILRVCLAKGAVDLLGDRAHPEDAARLALGRMNARVGATGGLILVDRFGRLGWAKNTPQLIWAALGERLPDGQSGSG